MDERLTKEPISTRLAAPQIMSAWVPLVVVKTIVRPSTACGVYSQGELPKSNPSIGKPPRSPPNSGARSEFFDFGRGDEEAAPENSAEAATRALAKTSPCPGKSAARCRTSSTSAQGMTPTAPAASAAVIVVEARNTSITTTTL